MTVLALGAMSVRAAPTLSVGDCVGPPVFTVAPWSLLVMRLGMSLVAMTLI